MEEKKEIKISLSIFFLILVVIVIIIMTYFIYKFYNEKTIETQKVTDLNNEVSSLQSTVNNLNEKISNVSNIVNNSINFNEKVQTSSNIDNYTEINKELDKDNFLYVTDVVNKDNENYILKGIIYTPHIMSVNELEEATKKGIYIYNNKNYIIKKDYDDYDYAFLDSQDTNHVEQYAKKKDSNSYYLYGFSTADFYNFLDATDINKYINISKSIPVEDIYEDSIAKDYFKNYKVSTISENNHQPNLVFLSNLIMENVQK